MKLKSKEKKKEPEVEPSVKFIDRVEKPPVKELSPTEEIIDTFVKHKLIRPNHEAVSIV